MWIRVLSYSGGSPEAITVLNACVNTSKDSGVLFSSGRKTGDITFAADKSVSRKHCLLRCVGNYDTLLPPRNDAERKACERNPLGMCVVLENSGKAGCYIAELPPSVKSTVNDNSDADNGDSDTDAGSDDDETDDEGVSQSVQKRKASQLSSVHSQKLALYGDGSPVTDVQLAPASKRILGKTSSDVQLIKLNVDESRVLNFDDAITKSNGIEHSIVVQCGLNESVIEIVWVPFVLTVSRMPKKFSKLNSEFYKIGATEESFISENTTHLITPEALGTAKPLTAWCRGIPLLAPSYIEALLDRTSCAAVVPDVNDHLTPVKESLSFLSAAANPKLMAPYVVLTLESGDMEQLISFSGAQVVPLHLAGNDEDALSKAKEALKIANRRRRVCLILWSRKKLHDKVVALGVLSVKQNTWAKAISHQDPNIKDANGKPIEIGKLVSTEEEVMRDDADRHESNPVAMSGHSQSITSRGTQEESYSDKFATRKYTSSGMSQTDVTLTDSQGSSRHQKRLDTAASVDTTSQISSIDHLTAEREPLQYKSSDALSKMDTEMDEASAPPVESEDDDEMPKKRTRQHRDDNASTTSSKSLSTVTDCLGKADSTGWFAVAPKDDAKRKAWRKRASKENSLQDEGEYFHPPALTTRSVAIVSPDQAPPNTAPVLGHRNRNSGPDFKLFRKNLIPPAHTQRIKMRAVHPKETEQQRQLEADQRELDAEQERADELFHDTGAAPSRKRRRR